LYSETFLAYSLVNLGEAQPPKKTAIAIIRFSYCHGWPSSASDKKL